ncbi:DMT family transporter [Thalassobacillus pellis]|uniref:DMT family transporter n=1 Tax=Thalassobacillus pellis TaxID=748008 RepID=UPI00195FDA81|nr:multidrug efflux SMR transporter [Thalassobacillus pellis]MBM7551289.1 paired small multidrug resistance pump [Thalassobacillus pellis]
MKATWYKVVLAALFEVGWVIGLKHSNNSWEWIGTGIAIAVSFYYLVTAGKNLPVGTVYAVFVGLGTTGTVICEILFFGVPADADKLMWIALLVMGIIGLKLVTDISEGKEKEIN